MGAAAPALAFVSVVSSFIGARKQAKAARQSRAAQEKAARIQNKQSNIARQRGVRQSLARARVLRAQTQAAGFAGGLQGSSIVSGAIGGIATDAAANVGAAGVQGGLETARVGALNVAGAAQTRGAVAATQFGAISDIAGLFSNAKNNRSIFGF